MQKIQYNWVIFIFMPLLIFPVFWMIASLFDWLIGDATVVLEILHESKGQLLRDFLADWIASLPVSAVFIWLLYLPIYMVLGLKLESKALQFVSAGILTGIVVGVWLYRIDLVGLAIVSITGCSIGILIMFWHWMLALWGRST